jgi:hypothetical protein
MAALAKDADAEQIRTSEARHSAMPPPTAGPFTAAMTGCGRARTALGSAAIFSWKRILSIAGSLASNMPGPKSRTSMPEQKPRPVPVRITTRTPRSAASEANVCCNSPTSSSLSALRRSGRFNRKRTTPSLGVSRTSVVKRAPRSWPCPCPLRCTW